MCKIIFSTIVIFTIMSSILAVIKTLPSNDRTSEMVNFIGFNLKLARILGHINFLLDCRSLKIMPKFILKRTAEISKAHPNQRVTPRTDGGGYPPPCGF